MSSPDFNIPTQNAEHFHAFLVDRCRILARQYGGDLVSENDRAIIPSDACSFVPKGMKGEYVLWIPRPVSPQFDDDYFLLLIEAVCKAEGRA